MRMDSERPNHELPHWLWLWLPPVPILVIVAIYYLDGDLHHAWFKEKEGPIEWGTSLVLVPAVLAGAATLWRGRAIPNPWVKGWILMVTLGALYFGGEEVSWGQWIWHWDSPEFFVENNEQEETNLHNMSSWLNEKPRLMLQLWILVGGIVVTLRQRLRAPAERWNGDDWRIWFWPTWVAFPTAVLALAVYMPKRIEKWFFGHFEDGTLLADLHLSEPQEFYFAVFMMLYLVSLSVRTARATRG